MVPFAREIAYPGPPPSVRCFGHAVEITIRARRVTAIASVVALVGAGAAYGLYLGLLQMLGAGTPSGQRVGAGILVLLFGTVLATATIATAWWLGGKEAVRVDGTHLEYRRTIFGATIRQRSYDGVATAYVDVLPWDPWNPAPFQVCVGITGGSVVVRGTGGEFRFGSALEEGAASEVVAAMLRVVESAPAPALGD